jgi:hypothetical protein
MDFLRQLDLIRQDQLTFPITLIGAGGIGSPAALVLAKMGCANLTVYDDDTVEAHNLPNQLYRLSDLGKRKVEALHEILLSFTGTAIVPRPERVQDQRLAGLVISGVDSMAARRSIWQAGVRFNPRVPLYLDARMGAEVGRLLAVQPADPDDVAWYASTLFDDDAAVDEACTARAIVYNVFGLASLIGSHVKRHAAGDSVPREVIFDLATLTLLA